MIPHCGPARGTGAPVGRADTIRDRSVTVSPGPCRVERTSSVRDARPSRHSSGCRAVGTFVGGRTYPRAVTTPHRAPHPRRRARLAKRVAAGEPAARAGPPGRPHAARRSPPPTPTRTASSTSRTPLELAVATILSAQSTDKRVNAVTPRCSRATARRSTTPQADRAELEEMIHSTGFFRNKANSLIGLGAAVVEKHDGVLPHTLDELVALPGHRPQDRQRDPRQRLRRPGHHRRHPLRPAGPALGLDRGGGPGQGRARRRRAGAQARLDDRVAPGDLPRPPGLPRPQAGLRRVHARAPTARPTAPAPPTRCRPPRWSRARRRAHLLRLVGLRRTTRRRRRGRATTRALDAGATRPRPPRTSREPRGSSRSPRPRAEVLSARSRWSRSSCSAIVALWPRARRRRATPAPTAARRRPPSGRRARPAARRRRPRRPARRRPAPRRRARWPASPCRASARRAPSTSGPRLAGRPALLNVWASWCAPCRAELPALAEYAGPPGRRARCSASTSATTRAPRWRCCAELGVTLPSVTDPDGALRAALDVPPGAADVSYVVRADGSVARVDPPTPFALRRRGGRGRRAAPAGDR